MAPSITSWFRPLSEPVCSTGTASLTLKYPTALQGPGEPPRFQNYPSGAGQANSAGEPSIGIDWNPNVATLKDVTPPTRLNTGGVAFFTAINDQWRSNFDDCSSPAVNVWEDMNSPIITGLDPIGFVDHFSTVQLGISYPPPVTPGRIFALQLAAGSSTAAFSDNDGIELDFVRRRRRSRGTRPRNLRRRTIPCTDPDTASSRLPEPDVLLLPKRRATGAVLTQR